MDEATESLVEAPQSSTLSEYAVERTQTTARVAIVIVTDAALFLVWIGVAWLAQYVAALAEAHGVNEYFAQIFMWVSSASTLLLTLLYIVADITKEFKRLFISRRSSAEGRR